MIKQDSFILLWLEGLSIRSKLGSDTDPVFENLDLRIDSGEFVSISGIYGKDKISFINVLGCLCRPSKGKYIFDYNDITTIDSEQLDNIRSRHIGFMFKGLNIIDNLSVYKNIELPLLRDAEINRQKVISETAESLGLTTIMSKKASALSDLERHLVALARALVTKPILILADEPGEGLSAKDRSAILNILSDMNKAGTAVITFSDKTEVVERAARSIAFEKGKIKQDSRYGQHIVREGVV